MGALVISRGETGAKTSEKGRGEKGAQIYTNYWLGGALGVEGMLTHTTLATAAEPGEAAQAQHCSAHTQPESVSSRGSSLHLKDL